MNSQDQTHHTPERRPEGEEPAAATNLEAIRAAQQRRHLIAKAALEKVASQNAEKELETRRQRGGQ